MPHLTLHMLEKYLPGETAKRKSRLEVLRCKIQSEGYSVPELTDHDIECDWVPVVVGDQLIYVESVEHVNNFVFVNGKDA